MVHKKTLECYLAVAPCESMHRVFAKIFEHVRDSSQGELDITANVSKFGQSRAGWLKDISDGTAPFTLVYSSAQDQHKTTPMTFFFNPVWSEGASPQLLERTEKYFQTLLTRVPTGGSFSRRDLTPDETIISSILNLWPKSSAMFDLEHPGPIEKRARITEWFDGRYTKGDLMAMHTGIVYSCKNSQYDISLIFTEGTWNFLKNPMKKALREGIRTAEFPKD